MSYAKRFFGLLVAVGLSLTAFSAQAQGVLQAKLTACPAGGAANNIGDVNVCGLAWSITDGKVLLSRDGKILVQVKGLVINDPVVTQFNGTPDGVTKVYASLICGANGSRAAVASTGVFPIDIQGNAKILDKLIMPAGCIAPAIVVREFDFPSQSWLVATGF